MLMLVLGIAVALIVAYIIGDSLENLFIVAMDSAKKELGIITKTRFGLSVMVCVVIGMLSWSLFFIVKVVVGMLWRESGSAERYRMQNEGDKQ
ncbi:MAG: hypothetical protein AAB805_01565 [Patescibacteria group bacterium]